MKNMRKLKDNEIQAIKDKIANQELESGPAVLEFPGGEIMNPEIMGFLWTWRMQGVIESCPIVEGDRFKAQGLEGKVRIRTNLATAVLAYLSLPKYRRQIFAERRKDG